MLARRTAVLGTSVIVVMTLFAPAASAGELDTILETAREATYNASRLTVSVWGNQTQVSDQWVEHWSGGEIVRTNSVWSVYRNGRAVTMGDTPAGFVFVTQRTMPGSERYRIGAVEDVTHLGRPCKRIEIMEGDLLRATFLVDRRSGAVLHSQIFTDEGKIFRTTALDDFKPYRVYAEPADPSSIPVEVVMRRDSDVLPSEIAGYQLVDSFTGPRGSEQGFYSDGLFSFSLFAISKGTTIVGFEEPMAFVTNNGVYDMVPTAQDVRLRWSDADRNFVLVGDLPPDHARDVLAELPPPEVRGMFARWWSRLFG